MRLDRMGCFHQTRLSFMRTLLRSIGSQRWRFRRTRWDVDKKGTGIAVYQIEGPDRIYSLICYANDLPPEKRSDRVIATEWDATFTLFDGAPDQADIERLKATLFRNRKQGIVRKPNWFWPGLIAACDCSSMSSIRLRKAANLIRK